MDLDELDIYQEQNQKVEQILREEGYKGEEKREKFKLYMIAWNIEVIADVLQHIKATSLELTLRELSDQLSVEKELNYPITQKLILGLLNLSRSMVVKGDKGYIKEGEFEYLIEDSYYQLISLEIKDILELSEAFDIYYGFKKILKAGNPGNFLGDIRG